MNAPFKWIMALGALGAVGLASYYALRSPRRGRRLLGDPPDEDAPLSIDEELLVARDAIFDERPEQVERGKKLMIKVQRYVRSHNITLTPEQRKEWELLRLKLYAINPKRTFAKARQEILTDLAAHGWPGEPGLKIPHYTSPDGQLRLWFKPQAVWVTTAKPGERHVFSDARTLSYDLDIRKLNPSLFRKMLARRYRVNVGGLDGAAEDTKLRERVARFEREIAKSATDFDNSQRFKSLLSEQDPHAAEIAQDFALEKGMKLSKTSRDTSDHGYNSGHFTLSPLNPADTPLTRVAWDALHFVNGPDKSQWGYTVHWNNVLARRAFKADKSLKTRAQVVKRATAIAWAITKQLKQLPPDASLDRVQEAIYAATQDPNNKYPKQLFGPNMLATIAKESRSPEEYARRAEAWASAEAAPPSVASIAKAYRGAKPSKVAQLVRDARETRHAQSRNRWKSLIAQHAVDED